MIPNEPADQYNKDLKVNRLKASFPPWFQMRHWDHSGLLMLWDIRKLKLTELSKYLHHFIKKRGILSDVNLGLNSVYWN